MLNLLAWIVLIFKDVWWKRAELLADDCHKKRRLIRNTSETVKEAFSLSCSNGSANEVIKVEVMEEIEMEEDNFRRVNSYTESFGDIDGGEYLKKAYLVKRNDSTEVMNHDHQSGQFIPECDPNEKYEGMPSGSACTAEEVEGPHKRTKVTVSVNKKPRKTSNNEPILNPDSPQSRNYGFKVDLKVKSPGNRETRDPKTPPTVKRDSGLQRIDSWDSLEIQNQDGHESQNGKDPRSDVQSAFCAEKSPERSKIDDQQHLLQIKCKSPKSEFQDFDIIMRKRKRHTDTMQKAAEAFGDFGHREDKISGSSARQNISTRWRKVETATKTKTYMEKEK